MRHSSVACVVAVVASSWIAAAHCQQPPTDATRPYAMPADTPAYIRRAVESPERTDEMRARDFNRKPAAKLPQNVDAVYMILYYHDLKPQGVDTAAFNRKILAALKPGGIFLVIDHKAEDGSGWRDAATIHRIGAETIEQEVLAAGFELARESDLLANPHDDRTKMVFAPGTRGTTGQAVFVFRKPRR
jgi:predicted methyltransferase